MSNKQLKLGSSLSYVRLFFKVIIDLIYTPLLIYYLGQSQYGLYNGVQSIINVLYTLNLGFGSSYIRYFARYKNNNDDKSLNKLNGFFLILFACIGIVAFIIGIILTININQLFQNGLSLDEYDIAKYLMVLFTINLSLSFPLSVFNIIISANEEFIFIKIMELINTILLPVVTIVFLASGCGSLTMVVLVIIFNIITGLCNFVYIIKHLKNKFDFKISDMNIFKDLFIFSSFIAINIIVDQINWNIDKFLLVRYKGTVSVALYSVGMTLYDFYIVLSTSISSVFVPRVHTIYNKYKDDRLQLNNENTTLFIKIGRIQFLVLALVLFGFIFFGKPFVKIWAGAGYDESYYVALLLMIPSIIPFIQNIGIEIQRAQNKHKFRSIAYLIMALINLTMSIYLCQKYGAVGSAFGTSVSLFCCAVMMNIYYQKAVGINIIEFIKNICSMTKGLIIPIIVGLIIRHYFTIVKISSLILFIVLFTVIYCVSMWNLSINDFEKNLIKKTIKGKF